MEYAPGGLGDEDHIMAFSGLSRGNCRSAVDRAAALEEPFRSLYLAAGNACLAAFGGMPARWADAERAWSAVGPDTTGYRCYDHDVRRMVATLVDLHRQAPDVPLVRQVTARGAGTTRCPSFAAVVPDHGPVGGHQRVRLLGANLPTRVTVDFGTERFDDVPVADGREAVVEAPPGSGPGTVDVFVLGAFYQAAVRYTYVGQPATGTPATGPSLSGPPATGSTTPRTPPAAGS
jgi:hypothetical protein